MAFFTWTQSIAAGASFQPLQASDNTWKYQYAPYDAICEIIQNATAIGVVSTISSGSDEIQQESAVSAGGTSGVLVGRLTVEPITFKVKAGDLIVVRLRNTTVGAVIANGTVEMTRV